MLKNWFTKEWLIATSITSSLLFILFRQLIAHFSTDLLDAYDFPYYAWVIDHAISFLRSPFTAPFLNTNAFYSAANSYFFSDLLIPQAALGLLPAILGYNQIQVTNFSILATVLLNAATAAFFWQTKTKNTVILTFATITTAISPFIFTQFGHLQMLSLWPFFIFLRLLQPHSIPSKKISIILAITWFLQFLASFYLSLFLLGIVGWYTTILVVNKKNWKKLSLFLIIFIATAAVLSSYFIVHYIKVKSSNHIQTSMGEFITFSAHPTDYLFISYPTIASTLTQKWQKLNHHTLGEIATYPGTASLVLAFFSLIKIKKSKNSVNFSIKTDPEFLFFFGLLSIGFLFSLGPRLSVNGAYVHLPLPYFIIIKLFPFVESVRATARWSLLFYLALTYFSIQTLEKIKSDKLKLILGIFAILLFCIEILPLTSKSSSVSKALDQSHPITLACQSSAILAIYPFTEQHESASLITNLARKTQELLRSTQHNCLLVNGYGGFEPSQYQALEKNIDQAIKNNNISEFWLLLSQYGVNLVYIDSNLLSVDSKKYLDSYFESDIQSESKTLNISLLQSQPNSWYLVKLQKYDTVE